jgi:hypothetical protein
MVLPETDSPLDRLPAPGLFISTWAGSLASWRCCADFCG